MVLKFKDGDFEYHEPPYTKKEQRALDRSFNRGPWTTMWRRGPELMKEAAPQPAKPSAADRANKKTGAVKKRRR
ncbi:MAG: hypothetical protein FJX62_12780 [Alphaproteobacteria bacterium]|nr:hypothetical protein [Alphaproteobacteria bacterium]